jgi:hypothetical protein
MALWKNILMGMVIIGFLFPSATFADISIKEMALLNGKCVSAKFNGEDLSKQCETVKATHTAYKNGWVAFGFIFSHTISFSGTKETRSSQNEYILDVKRVTTMSQGSPIPTLASGSCSVSGDITKWATITCDATLSDKKERYLVVYEGTMSDEAKIYGIGFEPQNPEANVRFAIRTFDRIYTSSGIDGVQRYLETCYPEAISSRWLPAVINCAAIDFAGNLMDMLVVKNEAKKSPRPYFTEAATNQRVREQLLNFSSGTNSEKLGKIAQVTQHLTIKTLREFVQAKGKSQKGQSGTSMSNK